MTNDTIQEKEEKFVTIFRCADGIKTRLRFMCFMNCNMQLIIIIASHIY